MNYIFYFRTFSFTGVDDEFLKPIGPETDVLETEAKTQKMNGWKMIDYPSGAASRWGELPSGIQTGKKKVEFYDQGWRRSLHAERGDKGAGRYDVKVRDESNHARLKSDGLMTCDERSSSFYYISFVTNVPSPTRVGVPQLLVGLRLASGAKIFRNSWWKIIVSVANLFGRTGVLVALRVMHINHSW